MADKKQYDNNLDVRRYYSPNKRIYKIASCILSRCKNKNNPKYERYGGRGIICPDSTKKIYFMLLQVPGYDDTLTIDRIDNDGNYELGNLRWATPKQQANNTSKNKPMSVYETVQLGVLTSKQYVLAII